MGLHDERLWRLLFAGWAIAVVVLSVLPPEAMPPTFGISDLLQHAGAYAAGSVCAVLGWRWGARLGLALLAAFALGAMLEIVQGMLPHRRTGEWHDLAADAVGIAIGAAIAFWWQRRRRRPCGQFTEP